MMNTFLPNLLNTKKSIVQGERKAAYIGHTVLNVMILNFIISWPLLFHRVDPAA